MISLLWLLSLKSFFIILNSYSSYFCIIKYIIAWYLILSEGSIRLLRQEGKDLRNLLEWTMDLKGRTIQHCSSLTLYVHKTRTLFNGCKPFHFHPVLHTPHHSLNWFFILYYYVLTLSLILSIIYRLVKPSSYKNWRWELTLVLEEDP